MEVASGNNNPPHTSSPPTSANTIMIKKLATASAVYIPFAASNVTMYDLQGKRIRSFFVEKPTWKRLPNSCATGKMSIVRIITKSGKKVSDTMSKQLHP